MLYLQIMLYMSLMTFVLLGHMHAYAHPEMSDDAKRFVRKSPGTIIIKSRLTCLRGGNGAIPKEIPGPTSRFHQKDEKALWECPEIKSFLERALEGNPRLKYLIQKFAEHGVGVKAIELWVMEGQFPDELELKVGEAACIRLQWIKEGGTRRYGTTTAKPRISPRQQFRSHGIDLFSSDVVCQRKELVNKVLEFSEGRSVILIRSPPQTGKTSLSILLHDHLTSLSKVSHRFSVGDWDAENEEVRACLNIDANHERYIIIDDAHRTYPAEGTTSQFWGKLKAIINTNDSKTRIILFSAYYGSTISNKTPVDFGSGDSLGMESLKYTDSEFNDLVEKFNIWSGKYLSCDAVLPKFRKDLFAWTDGHPGIVSVIFRHIADYDRMDPWKPEQLLDVLSSEKFLQKLENERAMKPLQEGVARNPALYRCVADALVDEDLIADHSSDVRREALEVGIFGHFKLENTNEFVFRFPSPLIRLSWFRYVYEHHPKELAVNVATLDELITLSLKHISTDQLKRSMSRGKDNKVYERVWQMQFFNAVCTLFPHDLISPDVGRKFGSSGFLDFYINSNRKWGIEMLSNGENAQEHVARFGERGRYRKIPFNDFAVIDFCEESTMQIMLQRSGSLLGQGLRIVFYSDDFTRFKIVSKENPTGVAHDFRP